jgi:hypothetical protein
VVNGLTPTPSIGAIAAPYNLPGLSAVVRNRAPNVLTPGVTVKDMGNALTNDWRLTYCPGDLTVQGVRGAGVLLVTGNLKITGGWRFDGLIIVMARWSSAAAPSSTARSSRARTAARSKPRAAPSFATRWKP